MLLMLKSACSYLLELEILMRLWTTEVYNEGVVNENWVQRTSLKSGIQWRFRQQGFLVECIVCALVHWAKGKFAPMLGNIGKNELEKCCVRPPQAG